MRDYKHARLSAHSLCCAVRRIRPDLQQDVIELTPNGFQVRFKGADLSRQDRRRIVELWEELQSEPFQIREMVPISAAALLRSQNQNLLAERVESRTPGLLTLIHMEGYDAPWGGGGPISYSGIGHIWEWNYDEGWIQVSGTWFPDEASKAQILKARKGLRLTGAERLQSTELMDGDRWLPRGVTLIRLFQAKYEQLQPDFKWVVYPPTIPLVGNGLAQWGDLLGRDPWLLRASYEPSQLVKRLQCIGTAATMLGLECSALIPFEIPNSLRQALETAAIPCEEEEVSTPTLVFNDRFGRSFEAIHLHVSRNMIQEEFLMGWPDFVSLILEQGPLPRWLCPTQAVFLPISHADLDQASLYHTQAQAAGLRTELLPPTSPLGGRIAHAATLEIPQILVIGPHEREEQTVNIRCEKHQKEMPFAQWLTEEKRFADK
jgi:hypothetical protein